MDSSPHARYRHAPRSSRSQGTSEAQIMSVKSTEASVRRGLSESIQMHGASQVSKPATLGSCAKRDRLLAAYRLKQKNGLRDEKFSNSNDQSPLMVAYRMVHFSTLGKMMLGSNH